MPPPSRLPAAAADFAAPREQPLLYPGERPRQSFVLAGETVYALELPAAAAPLSAVAHELAVVVDRLDRRESLDRFLLRCAAAPLAERYAVIGYGSNPVPGQLVSKFGPGAVVPVLLGHLEGADVVYNLISNHGYAFAELLLEQPEMKAAVGVTLLDEPQLERMIASEGGYRLAPSPSDVTLDGGPVIGPGCGNPLYLFAGLRRLWVPATTAGPVAIAELPSPGRARSALRQVQLLELVIEELELYELGIASPQSLVDRLRSEATWPDTPPKLRHTLQVRVAAQPTSLPSLLEQLPLLAATSAPLHWTRLTG